MKPETSAKSDVISRRSSGSLPPASISRSATGARRNLQRLGDPPASVSGRRRRGRNGGAPRPPERRSGRRTGCRPGSPVPQAGAAPTSSSAAVPQWPQKRVSVGVVTVTRGARPHRQSTKSLSPRPRTGSPERELTPCGSRRRRRRCRGSCSRVRAVCRSEPGTNSLTGPWATRRAMKRCHETPPPRSPSSQKLRCAGAEDLARADRGRLRRHPRPVAAERVQRVLHDGHRV